MTSPAFGEPCVHGRSPGVCMFCQDERAALSGSEVNKEVGIANQHRARLKARIAGNVASGPVASGDFVSGQVGEFKRIVLSPDQIADRSVAVAEAILRRCGL